MNETLENALTFGAVGLFIFAIWRLYGMFSDFLSRKVEQRENREATKDWMRRDERFPEDLDLMRALALGGVLGEANGFAVNTLAPAEPPSKMKAWLADWWQIRTEEELHSQIQSLLEGGHGALFDEMMQRASGSPIPASPETPTHAQMMEAQRFSQWLAETFGANRSPDIDEFCTHLPSAVAAIQEYASRQGYALPTTSTAYDLGRAATLIRVGVAAQLHSDAKARSLLGEIVSLATQRFASWEAFALSYLLGRAIWGGGRTQEFDEQRRITQMLLQNERSPWVIAGWF